MYDEKFFDTGEVLINYAEGPATGPPMVLIHGLPGHWQDFLPIIPELNKRFHIYALDLRGHGKSGRKPGQYHASYYAKDMIPFLENNVKRPAVLFGMSAGGIASIETAARIPKYVRGLILGDSPIDFDLLSSWMTSDGFKILYSAFRSLASSTENIDEMEQAIAEIELSFLDPPILYADQPGIDSGHLRELAIILSKLDPGVLDYHAQGRAEEYLNTFDLSTDLGSISCPTLLLQADPSLGALMTKGSVEFALSKLEKGSHVQLKGLGHDLGLEKNNTKPLLDCINLFLQSL